MTGTPGGAWKQWIFTAYVRSPEGDLAKVLEALGRVLLSELRKRCLLAYPPSYLCVDGYESWHDAPDAVDGALEELLTDCFVYVFVERLRSLKAQLETKDNIDGVVFLSVHHFLHERQKQCDPVGFRVFEILRSAVLEAIRAGEIHVPGQDDPVVRNETVLDLSAAGSPAPSAPPATAESLEEAARRWVDELFPDLLTAQRGRRRQVVAELRSRLCRLMEKRAGAVRFQDLVNPLKHEVRQRLATLYEDPDKEEPDTPFENLEYFDELCNCVARSLESLKAKSEIKDYLEILWEFERLRARSPGEGRQLAKLAIQKELGIPRRRVVKLRTILGRLVMGCRETVLRRRETGR